MSFTKEVTIWCDWPTCSEWTRYGFHRVRRTRERAAEEGWGRGNEGQDLCPEHKENS